MSRTNDREYFAYRVDQENEIGDRAASPRIAAIHYELAYRYALRCSDVGHDVGHDVIPLFLKRA